MNRNGAKRRLQKKVKPIARSDEQLETVAQQVNFLQRLAAYRRWRMFVNQASGWVDLQQFHQINRFSLMAHGIEGLRSLNLWLAEFGKKGRISKPYLQAYGQQYMAHFARQASRRRHEQALRCIVRLLRPAMSEKQHAGLVKAIDQFQRAERSLFDVILRLQKHQARTCLAGLEGQTYLDLDAEMWRWAYKKR